MRKENRDNIKSADGILLKVGMTLYQSGKPYIIEGFGEGLFRGYFYYKGENNSGISSAAFVDRKKSLVQTITVIKKSFEYDLSNAISVMNIRLKELQDTIEKFD